MRVLDLFSGIGGFSLGLERAGMRTVAFCEIEPYCRAVLRKHWPDVPRYDDVRTLTADRLDADGIVPDVICGGFPCQDISTAGKGAGLEGERSGLWSEYKRLIGEVRPKYVIVENVAALLNRGLDRVLGDLAEIGYDAQWHCIPACAVGAPHRRDRIWIMAYPESVGWERCWSSRPRRDGLADSSEILAHPQSLHCNGRDIHAGSDGQGPRSCGAVGQSGGSGEVVSDAGSPDVERQREIASRIAAQLDNARNDSWWLTEPDVGRVAHGVSSRVDRLKGLGNAVVPQIPQIIGEAIMAANRA